MLKLLVILFKIKLFARINIYKPNFSQFTKQLRNQDFWSSLDFHILLGCEESLSGTVCLQKREGDPICYDSLQTPNYIQNKPNLFTNAQFYSNFSHYALFFELLINYIPITSGIDLHILTNVLRLHYITYLGSRMDFV